MRQNSERKTFFFVQLCILTIAYVLSTEIKCSENEEIRQAEVTTTDCTACEPTCINQNPLCNSGCAPLDKCLCKEGFVRDESNNNCIKPENCTTASEKLRVARHLLRRRQVGGAVYYPGGGVYAGNGGLGLANPVGLVNPNYVGNGLGFVGMNGQSPTACVANEIWVQCGLACVQTCQNPAPICPSTCSPAEAGCTCTLGNVRDLASGQCLPQSTYCAGVVVGK